MVLVHHLKDRVGGMWGGSVTAILKDQQAAGNQGGKRVPFGAGHAFKKLPGAIIAAGLKEG